MGEKHLSRRDFIKTGLAITASAIAGSLPFDVAALDPDREYEEKRFIPEFKNLGPGELKDFYQRNGSEGERAGWVDPEDSDRMIIGTWKNGLWKTIDGGKTWNKITIPTKEWGGRDHSVARDMLTIPGTDKILIVFDYSLAIGSIDNPNWTMVELPSDFWVTQTAKLLLDPEPSPPTNKM